MEASANPSGELAPSTPIPLPPLVSGHPLGLPPRKRGFLFLPDRLRTRSIPHSAAENRSTINGRVKFYPTPLRPPYTGANVSSGEQLVPCRPNDEMLQPSVMLQSSRELRQQKPAERHNCGGMNRGRRDSATRTPPGTVQRSERTPSFGPVKQVAGTRLIRVDGAFARKRICLAWLRRVPGSPPVCRSWQPVQKRLRERKN